jgi:hypothetical protein
MKRRPLLTRVGAIVALGVIGSATSSGGLARWRTRL